MADRKDPRKIAAARAAQKKKPGGAPRKVTPPSSASAPVRPDDRAGPRPTPKPKPAPKPSKQAQVFSANTAIFYPNTLTRPKSTKPTKGPRPFIPKPGKKKSAFELAQERRALWLGIQKRNGKKIDPTQQPKQDLRAVPTWVRAGMSGPPRGDGGLWADVKDVVGATKDATVQLPGKVKRDVALISKYGSRKDIAPSLKQGYETGMPRSAAALGDIRRYGPDRTNIAGLFGGTVLDTVGASVGPTTAELAETGKLSSKAGLGIEVAGILPFLRGPAAAARAAKVAASTRSVKQGARAFETAFEESRPIISTAKAAKGVVRPKRTFEVGDLRIDIPGANSGLGRRVEQLRDDLRGEGPTLRRAGQEYGRTLKTKRRVYEAPALALKSQLRHLDDGQVAALRAAVTQVPLDTRRAFHAKWIQQAKDDAQRGYHMEHAHFLDQAQPYLRTVEDADGTSRLVIADNAPKPLREAYRILTELSAPRREEFVKALGLLNDEQAARRAQAEGQVMSGGEYRTNEAIVQQAITSSPSRYKLAQQVQQQLPDDPQAADDVIKYIDSVVRDLAMRRGTPTEIEPLYRRFANVRRVEDVQAEAEKLIAQGTRGPVLFDDQGSLFDMPKTPRKKTKAEPSVKIEDLQARHQGDLPDGIETRPIAEEFAARTDIPLPPALRDVDALDARISEVYELVKAGADGRYWYDQAADIAKQLSSTYEGRFTPNQMAQIVAIFSQASDTVANMSFVKEAIDQYLQHGKIYAGRFPERQSAEAEAVLRGEAWEGRKRSSFYANIIEDVDPQEYARLREEMGWPEGAHPVTVDRWVTRWFTPGVDVPNQYYDAYEQIIQRMAAQLGWKPKEVQAAAWVAGKKLSLAERYPKWTIEQVDAAGKDAYEVGMGKYFGQDALFAAPTVSPHAKRAANMAKRPDGGGTLKKNLSPDDSKTGYFTSYGAHEQVIPAKDITANHIEAFRNMHQERLDNDRNLRIGIWHNPEDGMVYLDLSKRFKTRKEAVEFANAEGQVGIWDVRAGKSFKSGLSDDDANAIKRRLREDLYGPRSNVPVLPKAKTTPGAVEQYDAILHKIAVQRGWRTEKQKLRIDDRKYAEDVLFDWIDSNPDHPLAKQASELYSRAHDEMYGARNEPDWLKHEDLPPGLSERITQLQNSFLDQIEAALVEGKPDLIKAHADRLRKEWDAADRTDLEKATIREAIDIVERASIESFEEFKPLDGLPRKAKIAGQEITVGPNPELRSLARQYTARSGVGDPPPRDYVKVDEARAKRIADWYEKAGHAPDSPAVQRAYAAFARETLEQYKLLVESGYTFEFYPRDVDPYPLSPRQAIQDLNENKHMYVYPTDEGYGMEGLAALADEELPPHPLLGDSGIRWGDDERPVTWNDLFRAVHDVFGHGKEGVGFRADGEENAWRSHMAMYSPEARKAMTAETRGQNSWVNYGPHGEKNRTAGQADTVYAEQKATIPPDWVIYDGAGVPRPAEPVSMRQEQPGTIGAWQQNRAVQQQLDELPTFDPDAETRPGETDMFDFEFALPPEARLLTSQEATNLDPKLWPEFRFHGTDAVSGEQIFAERALRVNKAKPYDQYGQDPAVFIAENPRIAARYADAKAYDRLGEERGVVIAIPKSAIPADVQTGGNPYGVQNTIFGGETYSSRRDILFDRFTGKILGAVVRGGDLPTTFWAREAAQATIYHEFMHITRELLPLRDQRLFARAAGAKPVRDEGGRIISYLWDEAAEEKFARMGVTVLAQGHGPRGRGIKKAMRRTAKALQKDFYHRDVPDVPPHVADAFAKIGEFATPKGGRIVGAEDWLLQTNLVPTYIGYERGLPSSGLAQSVGGYIRRSREALFSGGQGRAIGKGPDDPKLRKAFTGSVLVSGFFKNTADTAVDDLIIASRIKAAHEARADFLKGATDVPTSPTDQAIKVEPTKTTPANLQKVYEILRGLDDDLKYDSSVLDDVDLEAALGLTDDLFPSMIDGVPATDVARLAIETQKPVPNVKWVPRDFIEHTGLLAHPEAGGRFFSKIPPGKARKSAEFIGASYDAVNDIARAMLTYFNPAYVPMNLAGNLTLNAMQQGWRTPLNLWKSVQMSWQLRPEEKVLIDSLMGRGLSQNVGFQLDITQQLLNRVGHGISNVVDLIPRRAAFIHEARSAGYTGEELRALLRRTDEQAIDHLDQITRTAVDAIGDFERAAPWEKSLSRWILFYPWFRAATRVTMRTALDHPYALATLVLMWEYAEAAANQQMGDRPRYARNAYPISTSAIGVKVPFTDVGVGLDDVVGDRRLVDAHGNPYTINVMQLFPYTTPADLARDFKAIITGDIGFLDYAAPVIAAGVESATGEDLFTEEEIGKGPKTFVRQLFLQSPAQSRVEKILMDEETRAERNTRAVYQRSRNEEIARLFLGSPTPTRYNVSAGQQAAALDRGQEDIAATFRLRRDAEEAGITPPDEGVLDDLRWKIRADVATEGERDVIKRAKKLADVFVARYPDRSYIKRQIANVADENEAQAFIDEMRSALYERYSEYQRELDYAKREQEG